MTLKQFISFIGGLILAVLAYGIIIFTYLVAAFSFGGETLNEKENREAFFFYSSVVVIITTVYIVYKRLKANRKFSAIGIAIPIFFAFYIMVLTGLTYFDNINYQQQFDKARWTKSEMKPFKMAKTLVKNNSLIGLTKKQIVEKLGATTDTLKYEKADYIKYFTDRDTWQLFLWFKDDKVIESNLYEEGLGI